MMLLSASLLTDSVALPVRRLLPARQMPRMTAKARAQDGAGVNLSALNQFARDMKVGGIRPQEWGTSGIGGELRFVRCLLSVRMFVCVCAT